MFQRRVARRRNSNNRSQRRRSLTASFQSLEPRRLLAVDLVADIVSENIAASPEEGVAIGNVAYFGNEDEFGLELWQSDGTASGTFRIADLNEGADGSDPNNFTPFRDGFAFNADTGLNDGDESLLYYNVLTGTITELTTRQNRTEMIDVSGTLFFLKFDDLNNDYELWKSDGEPATTMVVKDDFPTSYLYEFGASGGKLFFTYDDLDNGEALWVSDGTASGTELLHDIDPGSYYYGSFGINSLTDVDGTLFFLANDGTGEKLYSTDGKQLATDGVAATLTTVSSLPNIAELTAIGTDLYFTAEYDLLYSNSLWTVSGSTVTNVLPLETSYPYAFRAQLTEYDGQLAFVEVESSGASLWTHDSTSGTQLAHTLSQGGSYANSGLLQGAGLLFFEVENGTSSDTELWATNATPTGARLVTNVSNLTNDPFPDFVDEALGTDSHLFFNPSGSPDFYVTDGTAGNASNLTANFRSNDSNPTELTSTSLGLFFNSNGSLHRLDGTNGLVEPLQTSYSYYNPSDITELAGAVYFIAEDPINGGRVLWTSDGTLPGTGVVDDGSGNTLPVENLINNGNHLYWIAEDSNGINQVFQSDGSFAGSQAITSFYDNPYYYPFASSYSGAENLVTAGGLLYFTERRESFNSSGTLWAFDDTTDNLDFVKNGDFGSGTFGFSVFLDYDGSNFYEFDDELYVGSASQLWTTEGTASGFIVTQVQSFNGYSNYSPGRFAEHEGDLYFVVNADELWKVDGLSGGVVQIEDFNSDPYSFGSYSNPRELTSVGDALFFTLNQGGTNTSRELWAYDSVSDTAALVRDINPNPSSTSFPTSLTNFNDRLLFTANDGVNGQELWTSDGTEAGTLQVANLFAPGQLGAFSIDPMFAPLVEQDDQLFFAADDGIVGRELWRFTAPIIETTPPASVPEGSSIDFSGTARFTVTLVAATGTVDLTGETFTYTALATGDGPFTYTDTLTATDADGVTTTFEIVIDVTNVDPVFDAGADIDLLPVDVGLLQRTVTFTDPGADTWTGTVDYGDGNSGPATFGPGQSVLLNHTYIVDGSYTVTVSIDDGDSGTVTDSFEVTVDLNTPPTTSDRFLTALEDTPYFFTAAEFNFDDADSGDTLDSIVIDDLPGAGTLFLDANGDSIFDDPTELIASGVTIGAAQLTSGRLGFVADANENNLSLYSFFTFRVSDGSDLSSPSTMSIAVDPVNDPPTVGVDQSSVTVDEGSTATITGVFGDVDLGDSVTLSASIGTVVDNLNGTWTWTYPTTDGPSESQTVTITADDQTTTAEVTFELIVTNFAPMFDVGTNEAISLGASFMRTIDFVDPGEDIWTGTVNYGDSATNEPLVIDPITRTIELSHTYASNGTFTVTVTLDDGDLGITTSDFVVNVFSNTAFESVNLGSINAGIGVQDNAVGTGYLMHSRQSVFIRFASASPHPSNSDHLITVRHDGSQWLYNNNTDWYVFTPATDDRLLAAVDFDADTISSLEGFAGQIDGIDQGFVSGDLTFFADRWFGGNNDGEFTIEGTYFEISTSPPTVAIDLGAINAGIGVQDNAVGTGYLMHSRQNVFARFASASPHPSNSDHVIAVRFDGLQWLYNNNTDWFAFTPERDDRLLAAVDFDADSISSREGFTGQIDGIDQGFVSGDLTFFADRWLGGNNDGEFTIEGTYFEIFEPQPPVVFSPATNQIANEGTSTFIDLGSFVDPDGGDWELIVDWGDGSASDSFTMNSDGSIGGRSHVYPDDGVYTINLTVTDEGGAGLSASGTFDVTVSGVSPEIYIPGGPLTHQLDTSIGTGGLWTTDHLGSNFDSINDLVVQDDGKIVAVGTTDHGGGSDFAIVRYNVDGTLDMDFGLNGKVVLDFAKFDDIANAVAIQSDGKIVVAGAGNSSLGNFENEIAVARLNPDGSLDETFDGPLGDGNGLFLLANSRGEEANDLAIASDGTIILSGFNYDSNFGQNFLIVRLLNDGSYDTSFTGNSGNGNGRVIVDVSPGENDSANAVGIDANGKIVVVGSANQPAQGGKNFAAIRLRTDGTLDTGFHGDGKSTVDFAGGSDEAFDVAIRSTGEILLAGYATIGGTPNARYALAQFTSNGFLDSSFDGQSNGNGKVTIGGTNPSFNEKLSSLTLRPDGFAVMAGSSTFNNRSRFGVVVTNTTGQPDSSFNGGGRFTIGFNGGNDLANAVAVTSTGQIIAGGVADRQTDGGKDFVLMAFTPVGQLDNDFATDGKQLTNFIGPNTDEAADVVVQSDGKIVVVGTTIPAPTNSFSGNSDFLITRYLPNGSLDPTFGIGGRVQFDFNRRNDRANAVALQEDGKIIVVGGSKSQIQNDNLPSDDGDFAVLRLNPDGSLDSTFTGTTGVATGAFLLDLQGYSDTAYDVVLQPDGKILLIGSSWALNNGGGDFAIVRLNPNGSLDTDFDGDSGSANGKVYVGFGTSHDLALSAALTESGQIIIAGTAHMVASLLDFALVRLQVDGKIDPTFATNSGIGAGKLTIDFEGQSDSVQGIAISPGGSLFVVGSSDSGSSIRRTDLAVAKLTIDGQLDSEFQSGGKWTFDFDGRYDYGSDVLANPDGGVTVLGGATSFFTDENDFALVRFSEDGNLDLTFDGDGIFTTTFGGPRSNQAMALAVQRNGSIVVAGTVQTFEATGDDFGLLQFSATPGPFSLIVEEDAGFSFTPLVSDAGFNNPLRPGGATVETFTYAVDWLDGSPVESGSVVIDSVGGPGLPTLGSFELNHVYPTPGTYEALITVTDDDGDATQITQTIIVNEVLPTEDFGDAPESYATLLADDGARHTANGPTLGGDRDAEFDGYLNPFADGDDIDTSDDEDGVTLTTLTIGQTSVPITVNVQGGSAMLDAWIDFDRSGTWESVEQIFSSEMLSTGNNQLFVNVPSTAIAGLSFARFRLSTAGGLQPTGLASDGEVEDYSVVLNTNPVTQDDAVKTTRNTPITIDVLTDNGNGIDTDPDGDPLAIVSTTQPASGTVVVNSTNELTYFPISGFSGTDSFDYEIADGRGGKATGTITVDVEAASNEISLGPINQGVAVQDDATGQGYLLHSRQSVFTRFAATPPHFSNSDHLIAVRHDGSQWQYNSNTTWVAFTPEADDRLLAEVDFDADTIASLQGATGQIHGIDQGYVSGDLTFFADRWNGQTNDGEFTIEGTFFEISTQSTISVDLGPVNFGVGVQDNAVGTGYLLHSRQSVFTRFASASPHPSNSDHLIAVRHNGSQWQYNSNATWVTFTPEADDRLLAEVDFDADTIASLQGVTGRVHGIDQGFISGDLTFFADRWDGQTNDGEFTIAGTFFEIPTQSIISVDPGPVNFGIAVQDNATGTGFLMFSAQSVHARFINFPPHQNNSDHLIAVRLISGVWQYNSNIQWVSFTPESDDRLLASVDFDADTATSLLGVSGSLGGIEQGYVAGDLVFLANVWDAQANMGEFTVQGSYFEVEASGGSPSGEPITSEFVAATATPLRNRIDLLSLTRSPSILSKMDVSGSNGVTALDALMVINHLNATAVNGESNTVSVDDDFRHYDINQDGQVTAIDALTIINHINRIESHPYEQLSKQPTWALAVDGFFASDDGDDDDDEFMQSESSLF
ncbi:PKD domain-containing protein [Neorhodopirellula pilleata]|uniref:Dockerin type I repeat protein n=1 Tax=Neorhodopirellula pilleata TaxID=2714738 RepID=A0A5C5ZP74_9BACT|nr:PKD domain-containing protein [Neorhodopirellula pilleata]TWT89274.1 Dockerin type I repeat protein [Neorhodopirellula pilleata]